MKQFSVTRSLLINYFAGDVDQPNLQNETFTIFAESAWEAIEIVRQKESRHHTVYSITAEEVAPAFGGEAGPVTTLVTEEVEKAIDTLIDEAGAVEELDSNGNPAVKADQSTRDLTTEEIEAARQLDADNNQVINVTDQQFEDLTRE